MPAVNLLAHHYEMHNENMLRVEMESVMKDENVLSTSNISGISSGIASALEREIASGTFHRQQKSRVTVLSRKGRWRR